MSCHRFCVHENRMFNAEWDVCWLSASVNCVETFPGEISGIIQTGVSIIKMFSFIIRVPFSFCDTVKTIIKQFHSSNFCWPDTEIILKKDYISNVENLNFRALKSFFNAARATKLQQHQKQHCQSVKTMPLVDPKTFKLFG